MYSCVAKTIFFTSLEIAKDYSVDAAVVILCEKERKRTRTILDLFFSRVQNRKTKQKGEKNNLRHFLMTQSLGPRATDSTRSQAE